MNNLDTILVIIDPTVLRDHVVEKAKYLAQLSKSDVEIFINCHGLDGQKSYYLVPGNNDTNDKENGLGARELNNCLVDALRCEFEDLGISVNIDVCWQKDLVESIITKVEELKPKLVLKSTHKHRLSKQTVFSNTDWQLIRLCPMPLMLIKPYGWHVNGSIVAAVDPLHTKSDQSKLDDELISTAEYLAQLTDQTPSVFHAYYYPDSKDSHSRSTTPQSRELGRRHNQAIYKLLATHNICPEYLKIINGETQSELLYFMQSVNCNVLVVGALSRSKLERIIVGNTAEKILDNAPCDILVLKPSIADSRQASPST